MSHVGSRRRDAEHEHLISNKEYRTDYRTVHGREMQGQGSWRWAGTWQGGGVWPLRGHGAGLSL